LGGLRAHRWSLALLSLGVALSVALFGAFRSRIQARERLEFRGRVDEVAATLRSQLERPLEVLESVCALFDSSVDVSRAEFSRFVQPALTRHPGIRALEWLPLVAASERSDYERAARADGLVSFQFTEFDRAGKPVRAAERPEHFPIFYMGPGAERVFGFAVASERDWRQPIDHAAARQALHDLYPQRSDRSQIGSGGSGFGIVQNVQGAHGSPEYLSLILRPLLPPGRWPASANVIHSESFGVPKA